LPLHEALTGGRETVVELRGGEAVYETVPGGGLRIGGEHSGARRLAALNENEGQRDKCRENGDRAPSSKAGAMPARARAPRGVRQNHMAYAIRGAEFQIRPDHPPTVPKSTGIGVCQLDSVEVTLSFRESFPIPESARKHEIVS
jgi:hypothetical protein